jgi:hypothetical protein
LSGRSGMLRRTTPMCTCGLTGRSCMWAAFPGLPRWGRLKRRRQRVLVRSLARREPVPDFSCPVSRLQLARDEINKTFGVGFAEQHPEVLVAVLNAASSDWAASRQSSEWPRPCCWRRRQCRRTVPASCGPRR